MLRYPIAILPLLLVVFGRAGITEFMPRGGSAADLPKRSSRVIEHGSTHVAGGQLLLRPEVRKP